MDGLKITCLSITSIALEHQFMPTTISDNMTLGKRAGGVRCPRRSPDVPLLRPTASMVGAAPQFPSCILRPLPTHVVRQRCVDGEAGLREWQHHSSVVGLMHD